MVHALTSELKDKEWSSLEIRDINRLEKTLMHTAAAFLRLFASPEAQMLKKRATFQRFKVPRRWNSFLRFSLWYADRYDLTASLKVFLSLLRDGGANPISAVEELFAAVSLRKGSSGNRFVRSFHDVKLNPEEEDADGMNVSAKGIRAAFNSPFPPYVLVSTNVGQEGLDFHRYCSSIIHWSPPGSPSALRQREGRLDRYKSQQVRMAKSNLNEEDNRWIDPMRGMSPDFVVMLRGKRVNQLRRSLWFLPYTHQQATWQRCLERTYYNDLLLGGRDPIADERLLREALAELSEGEQRKRLKLLADYAVSLRPPPVPTRSV